MSKRRKSHAENLASFGRLSSFAMNPSTRWGFNDVASPQRKSIGSSNGMTPRNLQRALSHRSVSDFGEELPVIHQQVDSDWQHEREYLKSEIRRLQARQGAIRLSEEIRNISKEDRLDTLLKKAKKGVSLEEYKLSVAGDGEISFPVKNDEINIAESKINFNAKSAGIFLKDLPDLQGMIERQAALEKRKAFIREKLFLIDNPPVVVPEGERPSYMRLSDLEREEAEELVYSLQPNSIIIEKFNVEITAGHLACLRSGDWLNDEIINFYMNMLVERSVKVEQSNKRSYDTTKFRSVHVWNTFFWQKLSDDGKGYNYKNVQRWSTKKKIDVFNNELMLVPINVGKNHWALGVVDLKNERIEYWDSLGADHKRFKQWILKYLEDEWKDKKAAKPFPYSFGKQSDSHAEIPNQHNSYDCGVFTCMFAECITRGADPDFTQDDIEEARLLIAYQIHRGTILPS